MSVVRRMAKVGGGLVASAMLLGKVFSPLLCQLQRNKTEEIITDESVIRRFEQSLIEGEIRFNEEMSQVHELIKNYFNVDGLVERLRTCRQEEKRNLWNEMKISVFARLLTSAYLNYTVLIVSKAQMILIAKYFSKNTNSPNKEDILFETCRAFMDEIKGFYSILVTELCPLMIEVCRSVLEFTNIDHKIEDVEFMKSLLTQMKRRSDVTFSITELLQKFHSSQLSPSVPLSELLIYCQSRNFGELLDYMICDGLDEIAKSSFNFIEESGKPRILLTWITFSSIIFGFTREQESINDILMKNWKNVNLVFSHLAVLYCEDINI